MRLPATADLSTITSGVLALSIPHLPSTYDEWAAAVAIVSGLVGIVLHVWQFFRPSKEKS